MVGALNFSEPSALKSCSEGGRRILLMSKCYLHNDVVPKFLVYDKEGKRRKDLDKLISQPKEIHISKPHTIIFTTPSQENIDKIENMKLKVKLTGYRMFDDYESPFKYFQSRSHVLHGVTVDCAKI